MFFSLLLEQYITSKEDLTALSVKMMSTFSFFAFLMKTLMVTYVSFWYHS